MEKFVKKNKIKDLKVGDKVDQDIFVVKVKRSITPYKNGSCFSFTLIISDSSGDSLEYKYWGGQNEERVKEVFNSIPSDSVILVDGKISSYNGKLQLCADETNNPRVLKEDEYEADFIPEAKKILEEMEKELLLKIDSIQDERLKKLLKEIFNEEFRNDFIKQPGAIQIHHAWIGGLIQHSLEVVSYCETAIKVHPELDRDLLITGAILHDIGKMQEITMTSRIKGTRKGQMVGHLAISLMFLQKKLEETDIDELTKDKLLHLVTSHHGKLEYGSPKTPMIPEAVVLYYSDELSSKVSEMTEFIQRNKDNEDEFIFHVRERKNILIK